LLHPITRVFIFLRRFLEKEEEVIELKPAPHLSMVYRKCGFLFAIFLGDSENENEN
jgi:hypothetical protein